MVMSPEHPFIEKWADRISNLDEIRAYQTEASKKSDFERTEVAHDKTGIRIEGVSVLHPLTGKELSLIHILSKVRRAFFAFARPVKRNRFPA